MSLLYILYRFRDISSISQHLKRSRDTERIPVWNNIPYMHSYSSVSIGQIWSAYTSQSQR